MDTSYLKNAPPFSALTDEEQQKLIAQMDLVRYHQNEVIFTQDSKAEAVYLIKSGWVKLTDSREGSGTVLANLGTGSLVGEMDLFLERPHSTTARAASDVELWKLSRSSLEEILTRNPSIALKLSRTLGFKLAIHNRYLVDERLKVIPPFDNLPDAEINAMAREFKLEQHNHGDVICHEGERAAAMYLVETGSVHLSTQNDTATVVELSAGDLFAEMALLTDKPYAFTAQVAEDTYVWSLARDAFERLITQYPFIRVTFSRALSDNLGEAEQEAAVKLLRNLELFNGLSSDALKNIAERLVMRFVPHGEWVYTEDMHGDAMYFVESGQVKIVPSSAREREVLHTLETQECFGEKATFLGQPRTDAAVASKDSILWMLHKRDFDDLVARYPAISTALNRMLSEQLSSAGSAQGGSPLANLRFFADLPSAQLHDIAQQLHPARYRASEIICAEGTRGDKMYFIENGEVRVTKDSNREQLFLANLGPGDLFGEIALLTDAVRSATVTATTKVDVWSLAKADLDSLMNKYPELMVRLNRILGQRLADTAEHVAQHRTDSYPRTQPRRQPTYRREPYVPSWDSEATIQTKARRGYMPQARPYAANDVTQPAAAYRVPKSTEPKIPPMNVGHMFMEALHWFNGLNWSAKLRLALIVILSGWIFGVSAPALVLSALPDNLEPIALSQVSASLQVSKSLQDTFPMTALVVQAQESQEPEAEMALAEELVETPVPEVQEEEAAPDEVVEVVEAVQPTYTPQATYTPFPTYTAQPPTATPIPPTETPIPTETPVPTDAPTNTPLPRPTRVPPTATPIPEPTNTAVPEVTRFWDPNMPGGIVLEEAAVQPGQTYWKLVSAKFLDVEESNMRHHTYVNVIDENGQKIVGQPVKFAWGDGQTVRPTESKKGDEFALNFAMYANIGSYHVSVEGLSDRVCGLGLIAKHHISYELIFQRVVAP